LNACELANNFIFVNNFTPNRIEFFLLLKTSRMAQDFRGFPVNIYAI